jgi:ferredoxin
MIVAEQKPFKEIAASVLAYKNVLVLGCGTCVTVCMAGGEKEVGVLSKQLKLNARQNNQNVNIQEHTITRQCDQEFFDEATAKKIKEADVVLSLGCGVGVQYLVEIFPDTIVRPGLNTKFFGANLQQGVWGERCAGCGECVLDKFEGICPIARCSKSLLNGPCGGSENGMCEVDPENTECGWQLIYDRLSRLGKLNNLLKNHPPKDWSTNRDGGPRKVIREDMMFD